MSHLRLSLRQSIVLGNRTVVAMVNIPLRRCAEWLDVDRDKVNICFYEDSVSIVKSSLSILLTHFTHCCGDDSL